MILGKSLTSLGDSLHLKSPPSIAEWAEQDGRTQKRPQGATSLANIVITGVNSHQGQVGTIKGPGQAGTESRLPAFCCGCQPWMSWGHIFLTGLRLGSPLGCCW